MGNGIKSIEELVEIVEELKERNKKIVTTSGTFDLYHAAHARLFYKMGALGKLIVLVNSDTSTRMNKKPPRPYHSELDRAGLVASHEAVFCATIFPDEKPLRYLEVIKPHIHAKGGSWISGRISEERDLVASWGGEYKTFPLEEGYSSTDIEQRILEANRALRGD
jgi:D-glycero-beta-D-manno-heptose 1-phosphate adenylyltransferase